MIVDPDFDLHLAAKRIAWGRFCNAGQVNNSLASS